MASASARARRSYAAGLHLADRRMPAPGYEQFDVVEQLPLGLATAVEARARSSRSEAAFHHGVVVAVTAPAHASDAAVRTAMSST